MITLSNLSQFSVFAPLERELNFQQNLCNTQLTYVEIIGKHFFEMQCVKQSVNANCSYAVFTLYSLKRPTLSTTCLHLRVRPPWLHERARESRSTLQTITSSCRPATSNLTILQYCVCSSSTGWVVGMCWLTGWNCCFTCLYSITCLISVFKLLSSLLILC